MVVLPLLLLLGAVSISRGALQQIKQGKRVVALFEGDENGEGKAWYPLYEGGFAKGVPNKRGKVSVPGGATYLGKFSQGKPVGKGRLVDLTRKKQKGKFSSISEVINRMFTKDCDVGVTFPDQVVTKGKPKSRVFNLVGGGYYIGKIDKKSKSANKKGTAFLVQYNGTWANGKWDGAGVLTYPGGYEILGRFVAGKPYYVTGWQPSTGVTTFGGKLGSKGFQNIASGDLLQPCSVSSGSSNTSSSPSPPSSPSPTTTPETPCTNCTTTDGRRCQFPFFVDGKEYNSCTLDHTIEGTTTPWCATRVDGMGNWLSRQGSDAHGFCSSDCPVDAPACPFRETGFPASCAGRHNSTHKNILFLGNSYTGGTGGLPAKVNSLAQGAGFSASISAVTPGGQTFAGHSTGSINSITGGDWDYVVLQGQSQRSSFGSGYVNYYIVPETVILGNAIKATNPCTVPLFYQTWGKRDGDSQNCGNHDLFCSYEGIQDQLTQSYSTYAYVNQPAKVAPVGEAWRTYSDRNSLFAGDGSHASSKGWFLAACVMFEQIWGVPASTSTYTEGDDLKAQATAIVNDGRQWSWPGNSGPPCPPPELPGLPWPGCEA